MKLSRFFRKAALIAACGLALVGCGQNIGPNADTPQLRGETTITEVFNGAGMGQQTRIAGSALQAKESYNASGRIIIDGNVPDGAKINISSGELLVTGKVGNNVSINVGQPIATHTEKQTGWCYGYDFASGKFEYSYKMTPRCDVTITDGLVYHDHDAAVEIAGGIGTNVRIYTPGRIIVSGQPMSNPNQLNPAAPRPGS